MNKITIDAGHYFNTPGKRTPDGIREWSLNSDVVKLIISKLSGYNVEVIRIDDATGNTDVTLITRSNKVNSINPLCHISVHHNALAGVWGNHGGVEVYSNDKGKNLATTMVNNMARNTGLRNRGLKNADLHMTREIKTTSILCEGGFMDSNTDYSVITSNKGKDAYASAVAESLISYFNLGKTETGAKDEVIPKNETIIKDTELKGQSKNIGDVVELNGYLFKSSDGRTKVKTNVKSGIITRIIAGAKAPYLINNGTGWVDDEGINNKIVNIPVTPVPVPVDNNNYKVGDVVKVKMTAKTFATGQNIASFVKGRSYKIIQTKVDRVLLADINSWLRLSDVEK